MQWVCPYVCKMVQGSKSGDTEVCQSPFVVTSAHPNSVMVSCIQSAALRKCTHAVHEVILAPAYCRGAPGVTGKVDARTARYAYASGMSIELCS